MEYGGYFNLRVDQNNQNLKWDAVSNTIRYNLEVYDNETNKLILEKSFDSDTSSYDLNSDLNNTKIDSGKIRIRLEAVREGTDFADSAYFQYVSPYDKLESPTNLTWDENDEEDKY